MRTHRFYVAPDTIELKHDFWLHEERLLNQWRRVLRFQAGQQVVLFDGVEAERLYKIAELTEHEAHLELVTDFVRKTPSKEIYLFFNQERALKIVIEAAEQCGRSDIPSVREPIDVATIFDEFKDKLPLFICEQGSDVPSVASLAQAGILIGPEGGWSDTEKELFKTNNLQHLNLHDFTLRAETAAVAAATILLQ